MEVTASRNTRRRCYESRQVEVGEMGIEVTLRVTREQPVAQLLDTTNTTGIPQ